MDSDREQEPGGGGGWLRGLETVLCGGPALAIATAVVGVALSLPLFVPKLVPFQDYAPHLALATIIRHGHDPAWGFADHFVVQWLELSNYWLQYASLALLGLVLPMDFAGRIQLALILVVTVLAAMNLCRVTGRSPWIGLAVAPILYNTNLTYGFISFCMAIPIWLLALAATERLCAAPTRRRAIIAGVLYGLTFFAHAQVFMLLVATAGVWVLMHEGPAGWKERARRLIPLAATVTALFVPWFLMTFVLPPSANEVVHFKTGDHNVGRLGALGLDFRTIREVLQRFFRSHLSTLRAESDRPLFVAWTLGVLAALLARTGAPAFRDVRQALHAFRLEAVLGLTIAGFLFLPSSMRGIFYLSPRFLSVAFLLLAILPRFRGVRAAAVYGVAAALLTVWQSTIFFSEYRRVDAEVGNVDAALAALPMGARTMVVSFAGKSDVVHLEPWVHIGSYAMVRRGGITSNTFAKTAGVPVRYRHGAEVPIHARAVDPMLDENRAFFDHILVFRGPEKHSSGKPVAEPGYMALARATCETLYDDGKWLVMRYPPKDAPLLRPPGLLPLPPPASAPGSAPSTPASAPSAPPPGTGDVVDDPSDETR